MRKQIKAVEKKQRRLLLLCAPWKHNKGLSVPETNETTRSVRPAKEAAGSEVLATVLNIHAKIVPYCGMESQKKSAGL